MSTETIKVSIICDTYNQVDYIEDALRGFVSQKTNFAFEVLVHDDASTDGTQEIIRKFEKDYPIIIKPIYQTENKYSQGIRINSTYQYPRAKGKYIALCEGDDYWISTEKLQKQYDILESHPELDSCTHASFIVDCKTKKSLGLTSPLNCEGIIPVENFINAKGGRVVETSSLFFRKEILELEPSFRKKLKLDTTLRILAALRGGMYYINEVMSSYRWMSKGSWTSNQDFNSYHILKEKIVEMLNALDIDTNGKYSKAIKNEITMLNFEDNIRQNNFSVLDVPQYFDYYNSLSKKRKIKLRIIQHFPFLRKIWRIVSRRK